MPLAAGLRKRGTAEAGPLQFEFPLTVRPEFALVVPNHVLPRPTHLSQYPAAEQRMRGTTVWDPDDNQHERASEVRQQLEELQTQQPWRTRLIPKMQCKDGKPPAATCEPRSPQDCNV
jgi:hypothetical protein